MKMNMIQLLVQSKFVLRMQLAESKREEKPLDYYEPVTAGGCPRSAHVDLTVGLGRFDSKTCPRCGQEIFRP